VKRDLKPVQRGPRGIWTLVQLSGVGLLVAAAVLLGLAGPAGADLTNNTIVPDSAQAQSPFTANTPFASGQGIDVVLPANTLFTSNEVLSVEECSAPNGVIPTQTTACNGGTASGPSVSPNSDGSFDYINNSGNPLNQPYPVYYTPDAALGNTGSSPACGDTSATECILYIGLDSNDFTQNHVWSQPFFIAPVAGDTGSPAGDGSAPPAATTPSPTLSTVVPSPATPTADGVDKSTVTVTLLATGGLPVAGKAVSLTPSSSTTTVSGPSPALTNSNGQTTFTVTDTVAEEVSLTAVDTTDSVTLSPPASVTFQKPVASPTNSTVSGPATVASGGTATIVVNLRDQAASPQPLAGQTVTLSGTGSAMITSATTPNVSDASGNVTFSATDSAAEDVTFTATDTTDGVTIANTLSVTFGTLTVSPSQSTVAVTSPAPLGSAGTTVVVTLLTSTDSPVAGKAVSLQVTSAGSSAAIGAPSPTTTGSNGQVSFQLTDSAAESVTVQATDTTDGITLSAQPTVTFAASEPSATTSSVIAATPTAPADGETEVLIDVTLKDQFGVAVSGKTVSLQGSPTGNVEIHPIAVGSSTPGVTDTNGLAEFEADDTVAETVTFTATDVTDNNLALSETASTTFLAGPADTSSQGTTVAVAPANPPADGSTSSTVTVTLTDFFSNPVAGKTIALAALNGSSMITATSPVTNQAGQATFAVTDATPEVVTYQATDVTDGNSVLEAEGVVTFGDPPAPAAVAADCSVAVNPSSVVADGTQTGMVSVLLYDGDGDPAAGKTVMLTASGGSSKVITVNGTSDDSGLATFDVSDTTTESVTYTAHDTTDSIDLTAIPVTVKFTAAAVGTTTTTTAPTSTTTTTAGTSTTTNATTTTTPSGTQLVATSSGSSSGNSGNTGSGSAATLATTGAPNALPWLAGLGGLCCMVGTLGRRRLTRRQTSPNRAESI